MATNAWQKRVALKGNFKDFFNRGPRKKHVRTFRYGYKLFNHLLFNAEPSPRD